VENIESVDVLFKMPSKSQANAVKKEKIMTMEEGLIYSFGQDNWIICKEIKRNFVGLQLILK